MTDKYKITNDGTNTYMVHSGDNTYAVTVEYPEENNEDVRTFECTCPAAKYHPEKMCKHVLAVIEHIDNEENGTCDA